jgi:hypothetical protein
MHASRVIVLALVFVSCSRALPPGSVRTVVDRSHDGKRVLFIGLDGVDWRLLDRFMGDGSMPRLAAIARDGDRRTLMTQHPPLSPLVWTTMMTGVSPLEHRILDFARFNPLTHERELIKSDERAVPAIWNIATYGGRKAGVFGMWATEPPEAINGTIVSSEAIAASINESDAMRRVEVETREVNRHATEWISTNDPDLAVVYFQGTDEVAHLVHGDIERARAYFREIDSIVGDLADLARRQHAELIIASDHGFDWGGQHDVSSTDIATAGLWHRDEGMFLHSPSSVRASDRPSVSQLCATLVALLGLPHDERMAKPIAQVASESGESVDYRRYFQKRAPAAATPKPQDDEAIARLKALGYIGAAEPSRGNGARTPASFNNEGLILAEQKRLDDAQRAFEAALQADPGYAAAKTNLASLLVARSRTASDHIALLNRSIESHATDDARLLRGRYRLEAHDCAGALADFGAITRETALRWASIAAAEGCLGHENRAVDAAKKSLALDPDQPQLRALLAN